MDEGGPGSAAAAARDELCLLAHLPVMVWATDAELRLTCAFGGAFERLAPALARGAILAECLGGGAGDPALEELQRRALGGEEIAFSREWRGRTYWCRVRSLRDDTGATIGTAGLALDVDERELASERRFVESLIDASRAIVLLLDGAGRVVRLNAYAERLLGTSQSQAQGADWADRFVPENERPRFRAMLERALAGGADSSDAFPVLDTGGHEHHFKWVQRAVPAAGAEPCVLALGVDISDLRQAQERALAAERLAAIGEVASGLAHQGRNALQRSKACLAMLATRLADRPDALDLLQRAEAAQNDLHRLYEQVRQYAEPMVLLPQTCRLDDALIRAWEELEPLRRGRHAVLAVTGGGAVPACEVDWLRIKQVFRAILENAIAAADPVRIEVTWGATDDAGGPRVVLRVADDGPGLDAEHLRRMFEPFYTTKPRGAGLGLALARRVVEAHGGSLTARPRGGGGAEVTVALPRQPPPGILAMP